MSGTLSDTDQTGLEDGVEEEDRTEADGIDAALSALPDTGGYIQVYHKDEAGDVKYLGQMDPAGFNLDTVRRKFGGGRRYVFDFYGKGRGKARVSRQARRTMYIERLESEDAPANGAAQPPAPALDAQSIAQMMAEAMRPTHEAIARLAERLDHAPQRDSDPTAMMTAMLSGLRDLHQIATPPAAPSQAPPAASNPGGQLSEFRELLNLAKEFTGTGEDDKESTALSFLEKAIDKIATPMVAAAQSQQTRAETPTAVEGQAQPNQENPMQMYVRMLMDSAARDEDPGNWVGLVVDRVPDHVLAQVLADPVGQLSALDERAKTYETWVMELAGLIREELTALNQPNGAGETADAQGGSDAAKSPTDGAPSR